MQKSVLEVPEPTVNESRGTARGTAREVVLFHQCDIQPAQPRVSSDSAACDPPADDDQIEVLTTERVELLLPRYTWLFVGGAARQIALAVDLAGSLSADGFLAPAGNLNLRVRAWCQPSIHT